MRLHTSTSLPLVLLPLLSSLTPALAQAQAQNSSYLSGLVSVLNDLQLTSLVNATMQINSTQTGMQLLAALSEPNRQLTVFAPTDGAFAGVASNISSNASLLADVLSYHIIYGNFTNETQSYPNTTIGRTLLSDMSLVMLEGGKDQVVAWSKMSGGNITVLNQNTAVSITHSTSYENLYINVVDAVIDIPGSLQDAMTANNLTALSTVLSSVQTESGSSLLEALNSGAKGFTLFAPSDSAISAIQSQLASLGGNATALANVLMNHIINGTSAYTSTFAMHNYTSGAGEALDFMMNGTGTFVMSGMMGNASAKVTKPDVILRNGVMHIIDAVLLDMNSDMSAASSAYMSATSVAAMSTTESGPVGGTPTGASSSSSSSGSSSGSKNGAVGIGRGGEWVVAVLVGVVGLFGGWMM